MEKRNIKTNHYRAKIRRWKNKNATKNKWNNNSKLYFDMDWWTWLPTLKWQRLLVVSIHNNSHVLHFIHLYGVFQWLHNCCCYRFMLSIATCIDDIIDCVINIEKKSKAFLRFQSWNRFLLFAYNFARKFNY